MNWEEDYNRAKELLNTADHYFYVTFKHSKSGNVLYNIIDKLVLAIEKLIKATLEKKYEIGEIDDLPKNPKLQADLFLEIYGKNPKVKEFVDLYFKLRKLRRGKYHVKNEFRKNVHLVFNINGENIEIKPTDLKEYLERVKEYFKLVQVIVLEND